MTVPGEPSLSIVIPAYNAEPYIREALESVLAQGIAGMEVIVVDDESSDRTGVVVQSFGDVVRLVRGRSSGGFPGAVRDAGIAVSRAPLIGFLDADDLMLPGRLQSQMRLFEEYPELGLAFTDYQNFFDEGEEPPHFRSCRILSQQMAGRETLILDSAAATKLLLRENFGMPSTAMMRRSVLEKVPGFQDTLSTSEDFVFFYRIAREFTVAAIGRVGAKRRVHGSNTTGNSLKVLENYVSSRRLLLKEETRKSNREELKRIVSDREIDLAREYGNRRRYADSMILTWSAFARSAAGPFWGGMGRSARVALRTMSIALRLRGPGP